MGSSRPEWAPVRFPLHPCQFSQSPRARRPHSLKSRRKAYATWFIAAALVIVGASTAAAGVTTTEAKRVGDAARVLEEIRSVPDKSIPQDTWRRARCVAVIPGAKKGALVVGGEYGEGFVSCRTPNGWSAPAYLAFYEGSLGAQFGVESIDLVMLVMNQRGVDHLLGDHVTLGADAAIAAGPVGRDATKTTDVQPAFQPFAAALK
jgi:lipid-binding SYLF domain-containing protein